MYELLTGCRFGKKSKKNKKKFDFDWLPDTVPGLMSRTRKVLDVHIIR